MEHRIDCLLRQFEKFNPERVILFGSYGTDALKPGSSDIDVCIIAETDNEIETRTNMYNDIDIDLPMDIILYTGRVARCFQDPHSVAHHIQKTGILLFIRDEDPKRLIDEVLEEAEQEVQLGKLVYFDEVSSRLLDKLLKQISFQSGR